MRIDMEGAGFRWPVMLRNPALLSGGMTSQVEFL